MNILPPSFKFDGDKDKATSYKAYAGQFYKLITTQAAKEGVPHVTRTKILPDGTVINFKAQKNSLFKNWSGDIRITSLPPSGEVPTKKPKIVIKNRITGIIYKPVLNGSTVTLVEYTPTEEIKWGWSWVGDGSRICTISNGGDTGTKGISLNGVNHAVGGSLVIAGACAFSDTTGAYILRSINPANINYNNYPVILVDSTGDNLIYTISKTYINSIMLTYDSTISVIKIIVLYDHTKIDQITLTYDPDTSSYAATSTTLLNNPSVVQTITGVVTPRSITTTIADSPLLNPPEPTDTFNSVSNTLYTRAINRIDTLVTAGVSGGGADEFIDRDRSETTAYKLDSLSSQLITSDYTQEHDQVYQWTVATSTNYYQEDYTTNDKVLTPLFSDSQVKYFTRATSLDNSDTPTRDFHFTETFVGGYRNSTNSTTYNYTRLTSNEVWINGVKVWSDVDTDTRSQTISSSNILTDIIIGMTFPTDYTTTTTQTVGKSTPPLGFKYIYDEVLYVLKVERPSDLSKRLLFFKVEDGVILPTVLLDMEMSSSYLGYSST